MGFFVYSSIVWLLAITGMSESVMAPVGPRASKEEFMQALALDSQDPQHEQIYRAMRVCSVYGMSYLHLHLLNAVWYNG